jgi:HEAT repeat protein
MAPSLSDVERMKSAGDVQSLMALLRANKVRASDLRAAAASALGELMDLEATETLIQAILSDPSAEVRTAASAALKNLLGNQAETALQNYAQEMPETPLAPSSNNPQEENDVQEETIEAEEDEEDEDAVDESEAPVDAASLVALLEGARSADDRAAAARALGELFDLDTTEPLIRAIAFDKNEKVRAAASTALTNLLGDQAEDAFDSYVQAMPEPAGAPSSEESGEKEDGDDGEDEEEPAWRPEHLDGLIRVLTDEPNPVLKIRACKALAEIHDLRAAHALAAAALAEQEPELQKVAFAVLESMLGDSTQAFIDSFKLQEELEDEDETDEADGIELEDEDELEPDDMPEIEEDEETDEDEEDEVPSSPYGQASAARPSVFEEEGQRLSRWLIPLLGVIIVALIVASIWYFFLKG